MRRAASAERFGGSALIALLLVPWIVAAAWPLVAGTASVISAGPAAPADAQTIVSIRPMHRIVMETAAYGAAIAVGAMIIGWPAGRWLHAAGSSAVALRRRIMLLLPIVTPAFVVFYTWWQAWPPGSALFRWTVEQGLITQMRAATLVLGLICWSWPLVAWCVASGRVGQSGHRAELLRLDGAGTFRRLGHALREDGRGLGVGGLIVFLLAFSNTTCFDLAQVFSVGNELRAFASLGAAPSQVLLASWPAVLIALLGAAIVFAALSRRASAPRHGGARPATVPKGLTITVWVTWTLCVVVPACMLALSSGGAHGVRLFARLLTRPMMESALLALATSAALAVVAFGAVVAATHPSRRVRAIVMLCGGTWMVLAALPGTTVAAMLQSSLMVGEGASAALGRAVLMSPVVLVIGGVSRFGIVAVLLARQAAAQESAGARDCRLLDGVRHPWHRVLALRPLLIASASAAACVGWVLSFAEIPVTARLHPPGSDPLALRLLNAMHYQREETVMVACLLMLALAGAAAGVTALVLSRGTRGAAGSLRRVLRRGSGGPGSGSGSGPGGGRWTAAACVLALLCIMSAGCAGGDGDTQPLRVIGSFGRPGISLGQFAYPRAIAADGERGFIYVVDKTARIQQFDLDGVPLRQWRMPESYWGKPVGLSVHPDGRVFVADTHYHRIIAFTTEGEEVLRFGTFGENAGEFIYPTDVAFLADGSILVSEYGGNDRIQVFTPQGAYIRSFGHFGRGPGELDRPQGILLSQDGRELFVADACNHRLLVFDPVTGNFMRAIGGAGIGPGEVHYPYDLVQLGDGTLLIAEFGNNRIQRLDPRDGRSLAILGGLGTDEGRVQFPWGVERAGDRLYVLDSGNNRVQIMRAP